jgi:hypothetical protein
MKLASRSAIESESSANAGSKASRGASDAPPKLPLPDSRREEREDGRRGVVGRERGRRLPEVDRLMLLPPGWGVAEEDMVGGAAFL